MLIVPRGNQESGVDDDVPHRYERCEVVEHVIGIHRVCKKHCE